MLIRRSPQRRRGFTLLEVLLASVIAVFLLAALYVAFDLTLARTDIAREEAARANLARSILNRITVDLSCSLGPMPPKSGGGITSTTGVSGSTPTTDSGTSTTTGSSTGSTSTTSSTSTSSTSSSTTSGTSTTGATSSTGSESSTSDSTSADAEAALAADVPFQAGVIGSAQQLTFFMSRVPQALADRNAMANPDVLYPTDVRRVTYYLGSSGLCRQERPWVMADGVRNSSQADYSTEATDTIAPEVADVFFEYFDGETWMSEWDGSYPAGDGKSVSGPPRAVRVRLTLEFPEPMGQVTRKTIEHVIAVRSANGLVFVPPAAETEATTTETGTTGTGTTTTTTTGGM